MTVSPLIWVQVQLGCLAVGAELTVSGDMIKRIVTLEPKSTSEKAHDLTLSFADREYEHRWDEAGTTVTYRRTR